MKEIKYYIDEKKKQLKQFKFMLITAALNAFMLYSYVSYN